MAEISDILTRLLERTDQDKVIWKSTVDERAFIAAFGKNSVVIQQDQRPFGFEMRILDHQGREIEQLQFEGAPSASIQSQLRDLYHKARRLALGVDSQLDSLLKELETGT